MVGAETHVGSASRPSWAGGCTLVLVGRGRFCSQPSSMAQHQVAHGLLGTQGPPQPEGRGCRQRVV